MVGGVDYVVNNLSVGVVGVGQKVTGGLTGLLLSSARNNLCSNLADGHCTQAGVQPEISVVGVAGAVAVVEEVPAVLQRTAGGGQRI